MIRKAKEWDERCRGCGGKGMVHKVEHFNLWTPEEYAEVMGHPMETESVVTAAGVVNAIVCVAHGGASIFEACKEGVTIAKEVGRPVVFEFNGKLVVCHADSDPVDVAEEWWKVAYGKTYEESMRDR